jgi:uncharacterized protein (TIGR03086 family)
MEDADTRYERVARGFSATLDGVRADQWHDPTPCTDWDVDGLVRHVINTHRRVLGNVRGPAEEYTGDDLAAAWSAVRDDVLTVLADPELAATPTRGIGGEQPFSSLIAGLLSIDTLCHNWDLARATNQHEQLDPEAVSFAHATLEGVGDAIRVPGGFASALECDDDADAQRRFLRFTGREG